MKKSRARLQTLFPMLIAFSLLAACSEGRDNADTDGSFTFPDTGTRDSSNSDGAIGQDATTRPPDATITQDASVDAEIVGDAEVAACTDEEAGPLLVCTTMNCGGVAPADLPGCVTNQCRDEINAVSTECIGCLQAEIANGLQAIAAACTDGSVGPQPDASTGDATVGNDGSAPDASTPDATVSASCGNGAVDQGEVCDYTTKYKDGCPDGWGLCRSCMTNCSGYLLRENDPHKPVPCRTSANSLSNASDTTIERTTELTYNAQGNVTKVVVKDGTGATVAVTDVTYDGNQNATKVVRDDLSTGVGDDLIRTLTYNANGDVTKFEDDMDADGTADYTETYTYSGTSISKLEIDGDDENGGADGTVDAVYNYTVSGGNITRIDIDADNSGTTDAVLRYTYDGNGNRTKLNYDSDNNGTVDYTESWTYDANGDLTRYEKDFDNNGTADEVQVWTYDAYANPIRYTYDFENDNNVDYEEKYTYDTRGALSRVQYDSDGSGTNNWDVSYTSDGNGNITQTEWNQVGAGFAVDFRYTHDVACLSTLQSSAAIRETR